MSGYVKANQNDELLRLPDADTRGSQVRLWMFDNSLLVLRPKEKHSGLRAVRAIVFIDDPEK